LTYNIRPSEQSTPIEQLSSDNYSLESEIDDTFAEWDEWETIEAIKNALEINSDVILIEANLEAFSKLKSEKPDIVFNIAEGFNGVSRESQIPAILDLINIPYTGSDALTLAICLNKARTKEILSYHKISTPSFTVIDSKEKLKSLDLNLPIIFKPIAEGSSKGIFNNSLIFNYDQVNGLLNERMEKYMQPFIVEEYLPGREFTVSIIGNGKEIEILPIVEMNFNCLPTNIHHIYSYETKWILDSPEHQLDLYKCPANLDSNLEKHIHNIAMNTYKILDCKDWCRIDIRLDANNSPNIIEVNPLPGILPDPKNNSCFPKAARTAGYRYDQMINKVLESALKRYEMI
ncbi:ATP-grasp domain-containing protein, partial [Bacteroidota bacterium]